ALASRLRFTDTEVIKEAEFEAPRFLPILGTPQYSSTEFYLQKPDGDPQIWNYDYRIDVRGRSRVETSYEAKLKGRKVYWLGKKEDVGMIPIPKENVRTRVREQKLNMTSAVRCLTKGSTKFKVYFEDVTKEELSALIFCLNLEEESFHRIGRGKPYGMGAVKIKVDEAKAVKYLLGKDAINREEHDIKLEDYKPNSSYDNAKKYILRYSKELEESESKLLSYPRITDVDKPEIFRWFTKNRGTVGREKIEQTLPDILDKNQKLKKY
ncbi:MAG: RAMP superfamily CRISPR-associated protein, partial [Filifactor alocis]|nr:RAMP superfamily CRISPR-associated protein [Filifactor alocis]